MKHSAFNRWMSRIGLAAALLLVMVPTVGRVAHAAVADVIHHQETHAQHGHASHAQHGGGGDGERRPAIGDPECDYCPLLASMAVAAGVAFDIVHVPRAAAPAIATQAPRLRWWHPSGLGSRGPPRRG
ncbi:DUF2946 family protein [Luteimonas granuli]|uniref:DUF2946 domain-containing protein n=1 Tax=Luteimonas granuli TaxID=1176533 RepID=A0A518N2A2_9GAMM|nr:DUF2946 family protein [Luteimonas granuli]QDW66022.1 DUF2946 domain-containing protein [Luteimonas granuli]